MNTILCLFLCVFILVGCSSNPPRVEHIKSSSSSSDSIAIYKTQQEIQRTLQNDIPEDIKDYIATSTQGISVLMVSSNNLSVNVRVTILPDVIPMVAREICPIVAEMASVHNIESYSISFQFYSESNSEGIDKETFKEWHTENGVDGVFVDSSGFYKMTLDELFEHFDNFGKDQ